MDDDVDEGKSGYEYGQLGNEELDHDGSADGGDVVDNAAENQADGVGDGEELEEGHDNQPGDSPDEPDTKKPRIDDLAIDGDTEKKSKAEAVAASQTAGAQQTPQTSPAPEQQRTHANAGQVMMPGMGYSPMGFHPMMMMDPQMYGFNQYYNPNAAAHSGGSDTNKSGEAKESQGSPPQPAPVAMNPAMNTANAAVAAAMMYNPYMMQQFQGMMNSYYPRPGFPPLFNQNASNMRKGISLSLSVDSEMLSEYQLLVRQQLEIFEAGPEDVESNTQGRKKQVVVGQVGLRCKHCAPYPLRARGRGAVYYPAKLNGIYQAAQNMAGSHLCQSCQQIPPMIKADLCKLRDRRDNASGGKQYWADGCLALGVYETEQGLRLGSQNTTSNAKGDKESIEEGTNGDSV